MFLSLRIFGCVQTPQDKEVLREWQAGREVSEESVAAFGIDNCFVVQDIDEPIFQRMKGKSYKDDCTLPLEELCYVKVLHCDMEGRTKTGELVCNRKIGQDLADIFRTLYEARYPIESILLVDEFDADDDKSMMANNTSSFNFRKIAGTDVISKHGLGMAVDINPLYNPYVKESGGRLIVLPSASAEYADRSREFPCKIDENDLCCKEFLRRGFEWGGSWRSLKDYQHFEK